MTPLRERFVQDLTIRNYSPKTITSYVQSVSRLARYFGRSPDRISLEEIRRYQIHLIEERRVCASTLNNFVAAVRLFQRMTKSASAPSVDRVGSPPRGVVRARRACRSRSS